MYLLYNVCTQDVSHIKDYSVYDNEVLTLELRAVMDADLSPEIFFDEENLKTDQIRKEFPETWIFQNTEKYGLKFFNI